MNNSAMSHDTAGDRDPRLHVLVVDDASVIRLYYRSILEAAGYRVSEALNGLEGLEQALRTPFDLCIVDVNMPVMDGYAMVHQLRRELDTKSVPVLMTSTEAAPRDKSRALAAGANTYLVKPVAPDLLTGYVAALVGRTGPGLPGQASA